jgi:Tfp pilus assembly protein FimV
MDNMLFEITMLAIFVAAGALVFVLMKATDAEAEEVDALSEAEVYLAHGRKRMAQELLEQALRDDPRRIDIQMRLQQLRSGAA